MNTNLPAPRFFSELSTERLVATYAEYREKMEEVKAEVEQEVRAYVAAHGVPTETGFSMKTAAGTLALITSIRVDWNQLALTKLLDKVGINHRDVGSYVAKLDEKTFDQLADLLEEVKEATGKDYYSRVVEILKPEFKPDAKRLEKRVLAGDIPAVELNDCMTPKESTALKLTLPKA